MKRPSLVVWSFSVVCTVSSIALGWNAASDEKRRQMTINQINSDAASRAQRANQPSYSGSQYTPSRSSSGSTGSSSSSSSSSRSSHDSFDSFSDSVGQHERGATSVTTKTITRKETPEELAARIKAGAARGEVFMQWTLGRMYNSGVGVAKNEVEAVKWFRAAADKGDADGQASLGDMLYAGAGVAKDWAAAVAWWEKAARQGHGVAAKNAGASYQNGWGVPKSLEKARSFYKIAADTREPEAALWLGEMYRDGAFGRPDMAAACPLLKIAAEQGLLYAVDSYSTCFPNDPATSMKWLRQAANGGLARSRFMLGVAMIKGAGVPKDEPGGAKLVIESAAAIEEDTKPLMAAGTLLFNGTGVKRNMVEAARFYQMAAERNEPRGSKALTEMGAELKRANPAWQQANKAFDLVEGVGVPKDPVKGFQVLKEAAEAGNLIAIGGVGSYLQEGIGTKVDKAQGAFYLHTSALLGLTAGKREYGAARCRGDGVVKDEAEGLRWIKQAIAEGDADSHGVLGELHEKGECGLPKDLVKARAEFQLGVTGGSAFAKKGLDRLGK